MLTHFEKRRDMIAMEDASTLIYFNAGDLEREMQYRRVVDILSDITRLKLAVRSLFGTQGEHELPFYETLRDEAMLFAEDLEAPLKEVFDLNIQYCIYANIKSTKEGQIELYRKHLALYEATEDFEKCAKIKQQIDELSRSE